MRKLTGAFFFACRGCCSVDTQARSLQSGSLHASARWGHHIWYQFHSFTLEVSHSTWRGWLEAKLNACLWNLLSSEPIMKERKNIVERVWSRGGRWKNVGVTTKQYMPDWIEPQEDSFRTLHLHSLVILNAFTMQRDSTVVSTSVQTYIIVYNHCTRNHPLSLKKLCRVFDHQILKCLNCSKDWLHHTTYRRIKLTFKMHTLRFMSGCPQVYTWETIDICSSFSPATIKYKLAR